jgi:hypothetical protein
MERNDCDLPVLEGLRREAHPRELARERETVAAMATILRSSPAIVSANRRSGSMLVHPLRARVVVVMAALVLAATSALAAAATLPGPAQDVVSGVLSELGITLPDQAGGTDPEQAPAELPPAAEKGVVISELARTGGATGVEKGAAVSTLASGGKSRAGEAGAPAGAGEAPVETPNAGGTSTANTASGGASLDGPAGGTDVADTASGGRSAAGSGNADAAADASPPIP